MFDKYGERIKALRKSLKLTQSEFGDALGTSRDVIGNFEYGRSEPKKVFLELICYIYNVNPQWLLDGTGDMFNPIPQPNAELEEAIRVFNKLSPKLQKYALLQIKGLLEVHNADENQN